jgi:hypothetical protein
MKPSGILCFLFLFLVPPIAIAQTPDIAAYGRRQTFAAFFDYSNDSSHILLGRAPNRKFTELGFQYEYRLKANRKFTWKYTAEFRPAIVESDPTSSAVIIETLPPPMVTVVFPPAATLRCIAGVQAFSITDPLTGTIFAETINTTCGRRWTYVEGCRRWEQGSTFVHGAGGSLPPACSRACFCRRRRFPSTAQAPLTSRFRLAQGSNIFGRQRSRSGLNTSCSTFRTATRPRKIPVSTMVSSSSPIPSANDCLYT